MARKRQPKSQKEIAAEIAALKEIKPKVRRFSGFGDDHWTQIDAQIQVLTEGLDEEDISRFSNSDVNSIAYETIQWRDGEDVEESPAEGWRPLVR